MPLLRTVFVLCSLLFHFLFKNVAAYFLIMSGLVQEFRRQSIRQARRMVQGTAVTDTEISDQQRSQRALGSAYQGITIRDMNNNDVLSDLL